MYRNPEHYPDPTAGAALCQLRSLQIKSQG